MSCNQPAITKKVQFGIKEQIDCETPATISTSDLVPVYTDANISFDLQVNDRTGLASSTLSNEADVMGRKLASITAKAELIGLVDASTPPLERQFYINSGMIETALKKVSIEASNVGQIPFGIEITNGVGEGILRAPVFDVDGVLYYEGADFSDADSIKEKSGQVDATAISKTIQRALISSITGGSLREDELLIGPNGQIRAMRCTKNGDSYLYFEIVTGTASDGEKFTTRNKSLTLKSSSEDVQQIPVLKTSLVYRLRSGLIVTGSVSASTGVMGVEYDGSEAFAYVVGSTGFSATDVLNTDQATWTATADSKAGGFGYSPISSNQKIATAHINTDGVKRTIWNSMSSFTIDAEANNIAFINLTTTGPILEDETGDAPLLPEVDNDLEPVSFQSADMSFFDNEGSFSPVLKSVSMDMANSVITRDDANSNTGIAGTLITSRNPSGSMSVEQVPEAQWDYLGRYFSGRLAGSQWKFSNSCGNVVWVVAPQTQYSNVSQADTDGVLNNEISYGMKKGKLGDDELYISYLA